MNAYDESPTSKSIEEDVIRALAGLQLPHMPQWQQRRSRPQQGHVQSNSRSTAGVNPIKDSNVNRDSDFPSPTIRILVVSDIDLPSASALAEYTLLQNDEAFDASRIDFCIACGPFCRDEDLASYFKGKQCRQHQKLTSAKEQKQQQQKQKQHRLGDGKSATSNQSSLPWSSVSLRAPEETAALEGLLTAAISQLESIVCRVVFCPGSTDPLSTHSKDRSTDTCKIFNRNTNLRFTPNSRNIHQKWLPLAPGLGCAGLLFFDHSSQSSCNDNKQNKKYVSKNRNHKDEKEPLFASRKKRQTWESSRPMNNVSDNDDVVEGQNNGGKGRHSDKRTIPDNVRGNKERGADGYCRSLENLLKLAPSTQQNAFHLNSSFAQSVLVTHYIRRTNKESQPNGIYGKNVLDVISAKKNGDDENTEGDDIAKRGIAGKNFCELPWPLEEHTKFIESPLAQKHLALEIASGSSASQKPMATKIGDVHLITPGSLRTRGEFCIVDLSIEEIRMSTSDSKSVDDKKSSTPNFSWKVRNIEFHNMKQLP